MNKAVRLLENMDDQSVALVCSQIGRIDESASPLKQARYINELLNTTDAMHICMTDTMHKCGGCCLSSNAIKKAKKLYEKAENLSDFLVAINEADIGGKNLHISDGKIIAKYKKCYCNIPKKVGNMNKQYCECSAGWYKSLFTQVFEKEVTVKIMDTIVNGASECTFEISI